MKETLIKWRKHFHENPEPAFEEVETAKFIADRMREMGIEVEEGIGKTGVIGTLKAGDGDTVIGLRADMDCIEMVEQNDFPHKSKNEGRMHGCGHDGHVTTLLGAAKILSETKDFNGTVRFLFQPAEEPGKGAEAMIEDGLFERFPMDEIYGMHNYPNIPAGTIETRVGGIMASEDNFVAKIKGKGGHASSPHMGKDPLVMAAEIILGYQTIVSRNISALENAVISCTELHTDGIRNAIPTNVEIKGDTRSFSPKMQQLIEDRMRAISVGVCEMNGGSCDFEYTHEFAPTINDENCVEYVIKAGENIFGKENVNSDCEPWMGSEDFGVFLKHIPGAILFMGSGDPEDMENFTPLHNSTFDYNDDILEPGAKFWAELVRLRLK